jgi:hypothetical protein
LLIDNAESIYYGTQVISKAYYDNEIVWGKDYLTSQGNNTVDGYTVGGVIDKSNDTANWETRGAYLPSIGDFKAVRRYWNSWGDDIFNAWGFPYVYDPAANNYRALSLNNLSSADGTFNNETFTFNGRSFSVDYGYPVQGIFKIDVSTLDTLPFQLGFDGNLGSNGTTINNLLQHNYTLGGENLALHYNYNYQGANPSEKFYTYVVPYEINRNRSTRSYIRHLYDVDYLSIYSVPLSAGVTVYLSKQADVKDWIINDLQIGYL